MKNLFAYTGLGPTPPYCSINQDGEKIIVTVRSADGREAAVEMPKAEWASPALSLAVEALRPFAAADRAIGKLDGPVRFYTDTGYREIEREELTRAREALESLEAITKG